MRKFFRVVAVSSAAALVLWAFLSGSRQTDALWLISLVLVGFLLAVALWPSRLSIVPVFPRALLRWISLLSVAFLLVSIQLVRVQIVESGRTLNRVETAPSGDVVMNPRRRLAEFDQRRGRILDSEGRILAETIRDESGGWIRVWPQPSAWGLTGYYSPLLYGATNLEAEFTDYLSGRKGGNSAREWLDGLLHVDRQGYDLRLSLDLDLQQQATDLLAGRQGAVVLLDADSGAVLAMAGGAQADPNRLYTGEGTSQDTDFVEARMYWDELNADPNAPLIFRPTQGLYTPGSTFKSVTTSAVIDSGVATPATIYRDNGILEVDGRIIEELNRPDPSKVDWTLDESYAYSLNVVFAQVALQLGSDAMWNYASSFGFGEAIPFDTPTAETQLVGSRIDLSEPALLAVTGFGQGEILASPLQMAMVVAAAANNGVMMRPWVVAEAQTTDGDVVEQFEHGAWRTVMAPASAATVRDMLLASAEYGYASAAAIDGAIVGGKTGTAEIGDGDSHAWFTGFAEVDGRTLVVAVIVERGGAGSTTALPIGRALLASAFELN